MATLELGNKIFVALILNMKQKNIRNTAFTRSLLFWGLMLLILTQSLYAQERSSGYAFLKIPLDARSAALASAGSAWPQSAGEINSHPLALSGEGQDQIHLQYVQLPEATQSRLDGLQYALYNEQYNLGWGLRFLDINDIGGRDEYGVSTGNYGVYAFALDAALANAQTEGLQWSGALHYARYTIDIDNSHAWWGDIALAYASEKWHTNIQVRHAGQASPFIKEELKLPLSIQGGASYRQGIGDRWLLFSHFDVLQQGDEEVQYIPALEISWNKLFILRTAWPFNHPEARLHGGLGLHTKRLTLDYAYRANYTLKGSHHISAGWLF
jgi:hypothetical protein